MRIGIITFHFAYNCGALLQCVALCNKLEQMGHEVCVINYQPWYHKNRYIPIKNPLYFALKRAKRREGKDTIIKQGVRGIKGFAAGVYAWRHYPKLKKVDTYFSKFIDMSLKETKVYRTYKQLVDNPPKCDLYISGSDQLWNPKLTDGKIDPAYLLEFGDKDIRRVTYAMGVSLDNSDIEKIKDSLMKLDAISLREEEYYEEIIKATDNKVPMHIDIDPTFLLKMEDYDKYICKEKLCEEPFIFTYTMMDKSREKVYETAMELSKRHNMKIIDASANPKKPSEHLEEHRICGPSQFLWYIKNADYIVTNSFHGTAFSVNMKKKFVTIPHSHTGYRVTEILGKIGLSNRYAYNVDDAIECINKEIEWGKSDELLDELRRKSINYLESQTR